MPALPSRCPRPRAPSSERTVNVCARCSSTCCRTRSSSTAPGVPSPCAPNPIPCLRRSRSRSPIPAAGSHPRCSIASSRPMTVSARSDPGSREPASASLCPNASVTRWVPPSPSNPLSARAVASRSPSTLPRTPMSCPRMATHPGSDPRGPATSRVWCCTWRTTRPTSIWSAGRWPSSGESHCSMPARPRKGHDSPRNTCRIWCSWTSTSPTDRAGWFWNISDRTRVPETSPWWSCRRTPPSNTDGGSPMQRYSTSCGSPWT